MLHYLELPDTKISARGCSLLTGVIVVMSGSVISAKSDPVPVSMISIGCSATPS